MIILTFDLDLFNSSASIGRKVYSITTLHGSTQVRELDVSILPTEMEASDQLETRQLKDDAVIPKIMIERDLGNEDDDGSVIDVMCLYTPQVVCAKVKDANCNASDPRNTQVMDRLCNLIILETNVAFERSGAFTSVNLVYSGLISPDYTEEDNDLMCRPVHNFKDSTEEVYANVRRLRDAYGADLVSLLVSDGSWCGCGDIYNGSETKAYSVINYECASGYYSFAHEIGHNLVR